MDVFSMANQIENKKSKNLKCFQKKHDLLLLESTERCRKEPYFLEDGSMVQLPTFKLLKNSKGQVLFRPRRRAHFWREKFESSHNATRRFASTNFLK